jgi:hypothetical protein
MSAFVVGKEHINAMLLAALSTRYDLSWEHDGQYRKLTSDMLNEVGQMLLDENVTSVRYRYEDNEDTTIANLPDKTNAEWLIPFKYSPPSKGPTTIEAIKLVNCYTYQSCEHPGWKTSEARTFCRALVANLICQLPGYDEAPWEWRGK